jgi:hypothetical protein
VHYHDRREKFENFLLYEAKKNGHAVYATIDGKAVRVTPDGHIIEIPRSWAPGGDLYKKGRLHPDL